MSSPHYIPAAPATLLADLNEAQQQAVTHPGGPLLVVAGAGTGKTRVLTRRVAWLVSNGVPAHAVLAITFTNKAADVLRERLGVLPGAAGVWAGTFHGFGSFLLRRHGEAVGVDPRFTIADRDDQRAVVKALFKDLDVETGALRPPDAVALISHRKNGAGGRPPFDLHSYGLEEAFDTLYDAYHQRLRAAALLDFDDLLLEAVRLLAECEDVAELYRGRFTHVLVDEYQDTNLIQRDLLALLQGPDCNLTAVGDPDQSIYRWRGAAVRNILEFEADFPGARTVLLEQNYRSTANILGAAEAVIARNVGRHEKRLFTVRESGTRIAVHACRDGEDEGRVAARQIAAWLQAGYRLEDIAVFYRVNSLSRGVELALNSRRLPYVVVAGTEFFQRREVKDALAYARLVENPRDEAAFLRVVNVPRRGVGVGSLAKVRAAALERELPLGEAAALPDLKISARARGGLQRFLGLLQKVRAMPRAPVAALLEALLEGSGYRAALQDSPDALDQGRADNVDELVAYAREFDRSEPEAGLQAFLERAALVSDQDGYEEGGGRVSLMSVHAAKGLEFPCVLIVGAELGYFPHTRSLGEAAGEEEERRLFYVAMTRAMRELAMTHTARRQTYMGEEQRAATPYLRDVPADHIETHGGLLAYASRPDWDAPTPAFPSAPDVDCVRESGSGFVVGERVRHPYFGEGRLDALSGRGGEMRVTVEFDAFGRKQLLLRHARLERIP